ncbi:GT31 [Ectocarpus sp. CCAP 1310/34]|nr:GT31 [Ectocarpus sp. CCAP 1310/34]
MGRGKNFVFWGIFAIAVILVLQNILHSRAASLSQDRREQQPVEQTRTAAEVTNLAICILTRRSEWQRRHLLRQTWLQDVPDGVRVSHIFVMGEDRSYTAEENARLAAEAEAHRDILIAPVEEARDTASERTKHCIHWTTEHHEFDLLVKADDDSTLFLSRLFGRGGWLPPKAVDRGELLYFGKRHALAKVANPANVLDPQADPSAGLTGGGAIEEETETDGVFEFDYRGVYWPEHMEGGMYGLSRGLAEEIIKNDFRTYTNEEATVGVWVAVFDARVRYLADEQVLSREADYLASNGTAVAASFGTRRLRQAAMWCEYAPLGTLSPRSILAKDLQQTLDCLGSYERSSNPPRSQPLGAGEDHQAATLESISRRWPIMAPPNREETGRWWARMGGAFRGKPAAIVGTSATAVDRLPLYLLQGMHTLVMDDFFRVSERYTSWKPTMYMCVDPELCASRGGGGGGGGKKGQSRSGAVANSVESANRFARDVFAAFYVLSGGPEGAQYWQYLRQRVNVHWFDAGAGGGSEQGGVRGGRVPGGATVAGMGPAEGVADGSPENFRVLSQESGLAMGVEVLSYLGFSPIYVAAAKEELGGAWGAQKLDECSRAVRLAGSMYGTRVVYLAADDEDKLPAGRVSATSARSGGGKVDAQAAARAGAEGKLSDQENIVAWAKTRSYAQTARWDLDVFLQHFPAVSRLQVVRSASTVEGMFPKSPVCRDADDLDRFQKAVLCPVKKSLKHFSSFLTWHIPYGPVQGKFVWVKR